MKREIKNWDEIQSVGLICDVSDMHAAQWLKKLDKLLEGKKVCYISSDIDEQFVVENENLTLIPKKEINCFGKPKMAVVNDFLNNEFDLLLYYNPNQHVVLKYVYGQSKTHLRCGYLDDDLPLKHDFSIDAEKESQNIIELLEQVKYYLQSIKS